MTFWKLIRRSLRFHARAHAGVVLGAAIGSAALIGALIMGDCVRISLRDRAESRLGPVYFALNDGDRFFLQDLDERLGTQENSGFIRLGSLGSLTVQYGAALSQGSAALSLPGTVARQDGSARANRVNILGVDAVSWPKFAGWVNQGPLYTRVWARNEAISTDKIPGPLAGLGDDLLRRWRAGEILVINEALARQLSAKEGDELVLRLSKPSLLTQDAVLSPRADNAIAMRMKIGLVLPADRLGDFDLRANPGSPANVFLPLELLSRNTGLSGRANLLVKGPMPGQPKITWWDTQRLKVNYWLWRTGLFKKRRPSGFLVRPVFGPAGAPETGLAQLKERLARTWRLEDAGLTVAPVEQPQTATGGDYIRSFVEVSSARIFLEPSVAKAALTPRTQLLTNHLGFQSDTTNELAFGQVATNGYGVLTYLANQIRAGDRSTPYSMITAAASPLVPADLRDDEILVNEWLADDLKVKQGDNVSLSYYAPESGGRLTERTNSFRVRAVVPLRGRYADRTLMPEFPGLAKAESTRDWDAGFPLVYKIRPQDEAYWKRYRGTPKAFISLAAGQAMWANRFGALTAIRFEVPSNSFASTYREGIYRNLLANLRPADFGLRFDPVRAQALKAASQSQDFGQLFLGFSFFLVIAALLLMALLFQFGLEQRAAEIGTYLALGFTPRYVRRLLLAEGVALSVAGGILGTVGGIAFAKAMLWGLTTVWRSAVGATPLAYHVTGVTLLVGCSSAAIVSLLTIWLTLRHQARQPARILLAGGVQSPKPKARQYGKWFAIGTVLGAVAILGWSAAQGQASPEAFFGAGSLLLIAGLGFASTWLNWLAHRPAPARITLAELGVRGCGRRRSRSLATIALLASGSFVVIAIGAFHLDAARDAAKRASGTGGFALIGESTAPVIQDLNTPRGREFYGLDPNELKRVDFVPLRVRQGDEASCLNLNRAQRPRLLGVKPELLAGRFTFAQAAKGLNRRQGWELLRGRASERSDPDEIPAIGDANSIQWALGKKLGDTLDYTDERGRSFKLRLVGAVANSILQGSLIIDEAEFTRLFPGESGYRAFLIDAPSQGAGHVSEVLSRALQDAGLELTPAVRRLNAFNAVQNTYLGTFQVLGSLGLLLGSAGLGIVVLRNVLERRGELGLLVAVGFRRGRLLRLLLSEHGLLLGMGLGIGLLAAAIAILPALLSPTAELPVGSLALTLTGVLLNGLLWSWMATRYALRGNLLAALRNE